MARVPEEEIERLRRDISLERLVEARGIKLTRTGANLVGLCPFHNDVNTPNLIVTPDKNVFHCFACQASGSVIDWVMKTEGVSFRHAVEVLRGGSEYEPGAGRRREGSVKSWRRWRARRERVRSSASSTCTTRR
jgi:DNA primase